MILEKVPQGAAGALEKASWTKALGKGQQAAWKSRAAFAPQRVQGSHLGSARGPRIFQQPPEASPLGIQVPLLGM